MWTLGVPEFCEPFWQTIKPKAGLVETHQPEIWEAQGLGLTSEVEIALSNLNLHL